MNGGAARRFSPRKEIHKPHAAARNNNRRGHPENLFAKCKCGESAGAAGKEDVVQATSSDAGARPAHRPIARSFSAKVRPPRRAPPNWNNDCVSPRRLQLTEKHNDRSRISTAPSALASRRARALRCRRFWCLRWSPSRTGLTSDEKDEDSNCDNTHAAANGRGKRNA